MQAREKWRHRGAARPSTLRVRGVGGVALPPEGANDFRRKCSESMRRGLKAGRKL